MNKNNNMFFPQPGSKEFDKLTGFMDNVREYYKKVDQALKNIFKDDIKGSFLMKILRMIREDYPDSIDYYANVFNMGLESFLQGFDNKNEYDICCHIVGIHKSNTLFLSDEEKGKLQNDLNYQKNLCKQVHDHIILREYGSIYFRNHQLINGDKFLYFTMGYDAFVATMYLMKVINNRSFIENKLIGFYLSLLTETISILTLVENGLLIESFSLCRNLIELFFKYEVVYRHSDAFAEFEKFCVYEINYSSTGKFDADFNEKYEKLSNKSKIDKIDYLHFGWIDVIFDFDYLKKEKQYSISGLYNYLNRKKEYKSYVSILREAHKRCHMFSHGSTITKAYPIQSYFELMQVLYIVLRKIMIDVYNYNKKEPIINDINIMKKLEKDYKDFLSKKELLNKDIVEKYYSK